MREPDIDSERIEKVSRLTPREYQLYLLLLEGYSLRECADKLNVKYPTANTHMTSTYKKLEVKTRAELIIKYRDIRNY
jgi:DNA-binding CsgD family transcriptional regulator